MGHAMHSYYTWNTQPYIYGGHKIFVAEVASTVNEGLLIDYMLKNTGDEKLKRYLINYYLEQFRGTFFRQTMFAEFEKITHYLTELGEPLTNDTLCRIYRDLNEKYYSGVNLDKYIEIEWARIPHFYSAFYVYQYATGFSASIALIDAILHEGEAAVNRYLDFLSKGNSDYSIELLKDAGVDMTSPAPFNKVLSEFDRLMSEFTRLP
jgi:oligoendopeptidase F